MTLRTMRPEELRAWASHCSSVFSKDSDTPEYFLGHYENDPFRDPAGVMVAVDGDDIVATVRVFRREIYLEGVRVSMGGIGEVSTKEAYQRRGLGGALLKMAVEFMEREGLCVSLLFTGRFEHYARYGWFTVNQRQADLPLNEELPADCELVPLAKADIPTARGLYGLSASRFDGAVVREHPDYWCDWLPREWEKPVLLKRGGEPLAYADTRVEDGYAYFADYACAPGFDQPLALLRACRPEASRAKLQTPLCPDFNGAFHESKYIMARYNLPFALPSGLVDAPGKLARALADSLFFDVDGY